MGGGRRSAPAPQPAPALGISLPPRSGGEGTGGRRKEAKRQAARPTPYLQGHVDGLCGFYAIINAFQCLFESFDEDDAWELMAELCQAIAPKFPAVIWKGAGVEDTVKLFAAASDYAARTKHLEGGIAVTRPFARRKVERIGVFWDDLDAWFAEGRRLGRKRVVFLGLGYPDNHWTIVTRKTARGLTFFDSWELDTLALRRFTLSAASAKSGRGLHKLDTRQTFFIDRVPRA